MKTVANNHSYQQFNSLPAWIDQRFLLVLGCLALFAAAGYPAAPAWWAAQGVLNGKEANDYAVANQGQLKNMARAAADELFSKGYSEMVELNPITTMLNDWGNSSTGMDYAPANLGQLKAVAAPFYDALYIDYPWPPSSAQANDYAVANIGQLKSVFAFDVGPFDTDGDEMMDAWERKMFGDLAQGKAGDFDSDGLSNIFEFQNRLDPRYQSLDADGDGMPNAWELQHQLDPLNPADAGGVTGRMYRPADLPPYEADPYNPDGSWEAYNRAQEELNAAVAAYLRADPDEDGLSNVREFQAGTNPHLASTDGDPYSDYEEVAYGSDPLLAASIPAVRVVLSKSSLSLLQVATLRGEHVAGGQTVTLAGGASMLFLPHGIAVDPVAAQVTVTTDPVSGLAFVYVFTNGPTGQSTIQVSGGPPGDSYAVVPQAWRGTLQLSLSPDTPLPPGPSPHSPPPPEHVLFTAHRARSVSFSGQQTASYPSEQISEGGTYSLWMKPGATLSTSYGDDGFNGDADLDGDNEDPGDPRDDISQPSSQPVPASPGEDGAYEMPFYSGGASNITGPYGAPGILVGNYEAVNAYSPPDKVMAGGNGFVYATALAKLSEVSFYRGSSDNGWMGNGTNGLKSYTVTSTFNHGTTQAPTISYVDSNGETAQSTVACGTQYASMQQVEVRLQTNKDVEEGKPLSAVFVLTKTTVEGDNTSDQFVATLQFTINSGKKSDACTVLTGTLPSDVTKQGGVLSMRSPAPETAKTISYKLLPVEVMQHPDDVANSSGDPPPAQFLRLCRWLDAYDSSGNLATNYPRDDRDRIQVKIPAAPFPGQNKITVKIATKKPAGTNDSEDAATDLECDKIGDSFISKPIVLVGDGVRAGYSGDDTWSLVSPQDEQTNDPTHVASPGGKVQIELPLPGKLKAEFPIAKYVRKVKVQSYVVRSESSDQRIPASALFHINDAMQRTKDIYKQAHIKIEHQGPYDCVLTDAELDLINSDRGDGPRRLLMDGINANFLEDGESQFVFDKVRELDGGGTDFVRVIYMDCDFVGLDSRAVGVTIRDSLTGTCKFGVYEGFIVIPIKYASYDTLPAHEVGHALTLLHPKDDAIFEGLDPVGTPELPYMLMYRASTNDWSSHTEYFGKRLVKKDLEKLKVSPRPLFIFPYP